MSDTSKHTKDDLLRAIALTAEPQRLLLGPQPLNLDYDRLSPIIAHTSGTARRTYYRHLAHEQVGA